MLQEFVCIRFLTWMEKKHISVIVVIVVKNYMTIFIKMEVILMNYNNPQRYKNGDKDLFLTKNKQRNDLP